MEQKSNKAIDWLEFSNLKKYEKITHGIILRDKSKKAYYQGTLGDHEDHLNEFVETNWRIMQEAMELPQVVRCHQIHSNTVKIVTHLNKNEIFECDALVTNEKKLPLAIRMADCQAALLYDNVKNVIACVHAGWRGLVRGIYRSTINCMVNEFGCNPINIQVGISPSLGPDHAEFKSWREDMGEHFANFVNENNYINFWAIAQEQLTSLKIPQENIQIANMCTYCNDTDFFSHRRATHRKEWCGRNTAVLMIR